MHDPSKLRELASWYRGFAERTGNLAIWDARLRTAEDLEAEADRLDGPGNEFRKRGEMIPAAGGSMGSHG